MTRDGRKYLLARVERQHVAGELVEVRLILVRDSDTVHLNDGDEFVTVGLKVDPFKED